MPDKKIPRFRQTGHLALARTMTEAIPDLRKFDLGAGIDMIFIRLAIILGSMENRPVNISNLAELTRIPRPTLKRKVDRLAKAGLVDVRQSGKRRLIYSSHNARAADREEMLNFLCYLSIKIATIVATEIIS